VGIWKGEILLENLSLRAEALQALGLPLELQVGWHGDVVMMMVASTLPGWPLVLQRCEDLCPSSASWLGHAAGLIMASSRVSHSPLLSPRCLYGSVGEGGDLPPVDPLERAGGAARVGDPPRCARGAGAQGRRRVG
jgi:hypothetical protein